MDRTQTEAVKLLDRCRSKQTDAATPPVVDLRGLEAPEPMHRILEAVAGLGADEVYLARLPHVPHPLFPLLLERGFRWRVHEEPDNSALLTIRRAR